ncbi:MAG: hypothetical protein PHV42_01925 [Candidatus Pacebacteria bacterium]|nr:hypothetical protein [Candidatus Paceibacterota bacterium]
MADKPKMIFQEMTPIALELFYQLEKEGKIDVLTPWESRFSRHAWEKGTRQAPENVARFLAEVVAEKVNRAGNVDLLIVQGDYEITSSSRVMAWVSLLYFIRKRGLRLDTRNSRRMAVWAKAANCTKDQLLETIANLKEIAAKMEK